MKSNLKPKPISIMLKIENITGATYNVFSTIETDIGVNYYDIPTFSKKTNLSDKTIRRRIDSAKKLNDFWRYFIPSDNKIYVSCGILGLNRVKTKKFPNEEYSNFLKNFNWDLIGTSTPANCPTPECARKNMVKLFDAIKKDFPDKPIHFWYATERNSSGEGYHSHFSLGYNNILYENMERWLLKYLGIWENKSADRKTNVKLDRYDHKRNFLKYMNKGINGLPDYYGWLDSGLN